MPDRPRPHIDAAAARLHERPSVERLPDHLQATYGFGVAEVAELNPGTLRVDGEDGSRWVARVFSAARPIEQVHGDAEILRGLPDTDFPAERCATGDPVSVLDGHGVLVTEYIEPAPRAQWRDVYVEAGGLRTLGDLLGRLAVLPRSDGAFARDGGSWHHLTEGRPERWFATVQAMLEEAGDLVSAPQRAAYASLQAECADLDGGVGLPEGFVHADFVQVNIVPSADRQLIVIDWAGAGRAPRVWALAFLLWGAYRDDPRRIDRLVEGYRRHVQLEPEELARLSEIIRARPVLFDTWAFCLKRQPLAQALRGAEHARQQAEAIAARAIAAFAG